MSDDARIDRRRVSEPQALAVQVAVLSTTVSNLANDVRDQGAAIDRIEAVITGRPSWALVALLTLETSAIAALAVALATRR